MAVSHLTFNNPEGAHYYSPPLQWRCYEARQVNPSLTFPDIERERGAEKFTSRGAFQSLLLHKHCPYIFKKHVH